MSTVHFPSQDCIPQLFEKFQENILLSSSCKMWCSPETPSLKDIPEVLHKLAIGQENIPVADFSKFQNTRKTEVLFEKSAAGTFSQPIYQNLILMIQERTNVTHGLNKLFCSVAWWLCTVALQMQTSHDKRKFIHPEKSCAMPLVPSPLGPY